MSKRLRDGVMRFRLHIHSRWMMKTHWRAQSQRNHSGGSTPRTKYDSGQESLVTMNEHAEALHSSTTSVRRMPHALVTTLSFGTCINTSSSDGFSVCRCCQDIMQAFISNRLDYCNALLYSVSDGLMCRLQSVQNAAARLVTGARRRDNITPILWQPHYGYLCVNEWPSRSPSWSSSVWLAIGTGVSGRRLSAYFRR